MENEEQYESLDKRLDHLAMKLEEAPQRKKS